MQSQRYGVRGAAALFLMVAACASPQSTTSVAPAPGLPAPTATAPRAPAAPTGKAKAYGLPAWPAFDQAVARGTRSLDGAPGPAYWQQSTRYVLRAELNTVSKRLSGTAQVTYHNNSPGTLPVIYVQAYGNLFEPGAKKNTEVLAQLGGISFTRVAANGTDLPVTLPGALAPGYHVKGTVMAIQLPEPLAPGATLALDFTWDLRVPPNGPRGGQDRETYVLSYWYPQVAVYDDVNGWQVDQYLGNAEFYMGYADYDVSLTVPAGWLVTSTGQLTNAAEVLSEETLQRLATVPGSSGTVNVVRPDERVAGKSTRPGQDGTLTWKFQATNVRDVTWATSNLYLWDAASAPVGDRDGNGTVDSTVVYSFYRPDGIRGGWREAAQYGVKAVGVFSTMLWPYPWAHMSVVDGPPSCGGMEYPMLTCIGGDWNPRSLFDVIAHEIAHMWFPMMVGSDEKRYAWMDEGLAQYLQAFAIKAEFPSSNDAEESRRNYLESVRYAGETELMRGGDDYPNYGEYGVASYFKPATLLGALGGVVGDSAVARGLREYGRRWMWKHPMPRDFWNTMSDVSGTNLDWFWREWYYETWKLDQAIERAVQVGDSLDVTVENRERAIMPVRLVARNATGETTEAVIPVDAWMGGSRKVTVRMAAPEHFTRVEIDPGERMPDVDRSNQVWPR